MALVRAVEPVKLICGMIGVDRPTLDRARDALAARHGTIDGVSEDFPFTHTEYYRREMGRDLWRRFLSFRELIDPADLPGIKLGTQEIESGFASGARGSEACRRVNLDPGYVAPAKLVLATTKDFAHRVALGRGIYAEVTLNFCRWGFRFFPWTYPDFKDERCHAFLNGTRRRLLMQRRGA